VRRVEQGATNSGEPWCQSVCGLRCARHGPLQTCDLRLKLNQRDSIGWVHSLLAFNHHLKLLRLAERREHAVHSRRRPDFVSAWHHEWPGRSLVERIFSFRIGRRRQCGSRTTQIPTHALNAGRHWTSKAAHYLARRIGDRKNHRWRFLFFFGAEFIATWQCYGCTASCGGTLGFLPFRLSCLQFFFQIISERCAERRIVSGEESFSLKA